MSYTRVEVTKWEQAEFRLLREPVTIRDGTVYRWETVRRPGRCLCTWAVLCLANRLRYGAVLCEKWHESELTWDWAEAEPEGRY